MNPFPDKKYDIVYADPPWPMWGDPNKNAAAGKHYSLMTMEEITTLPIRSIMNDRAALFLWVTCPRMPLGIEAIKAWGLYYRGVAFNWVKTRKDGGVISGQGIPPTATKPTSELCLLATTCKTGRPFKLLNAACPQVVLAPREEHSTKPQIFRDHILSLYGDRSRVELFARKEVTGWDRWGNECPSNE